jgi:hypothetical protein
MALARVYHGSFRPEALLRDGDYTSKWMSYRRQVVQDARRSRRSRSRSEVSSLIRSNHGAVRQRQARLSAPNPQSPEERLSRDSPPAPMCCAAAHEPDGRRTLSVLADITGSTLRLILRLDSLHLEGQRLGARAYAFSYCRPSCPSPPATPETVPVNSPVEAKKTGFPKASANTGTTISVKVRLPDAFLKRPVPPVI